MTISLEHSAACTVLTAKWILAASEFSLQWPHHCETCAGWGGQFYQYDPSPAGVALSPGWMTDFEECPDCMESGFCPRCGHNMPETWQTDEDDPCPLCGWKYDTEGRPESPECCCYLDEELP